MPPHQHLILYADMNKKSLTERDICTNFITPALRQAGWDEMLQISEEALFTRGRILVGGKLVTRGNPSASAAAAATTRLSKQRQHGQNAEIGSLKCQKN